MRLLNFLPWKAVVRWLARTNGIADPVMLLSRMARFGKLSDIGTPAELMKAGSVLHARGLVNSQAIQHNLDWVWPYWVEEQFDPESPSFVPRAFALTHINLTCRNWTAVGLPSSSLLPIVDPRGLVTPHYDGWSLDCWVVTPDGRTLVPSKADGVEQFQNVNGAQAVETRCHASGHGLTLTTRTQVSKMDGIPVCRIEIEATGPMGSRLVIGIRPYNPEGISFINSIDRDASGDACVVNEEDAVFFRPEPQEMLFSTYEEGDVFRRVVGAVSEITPGAEGASGAECEVGMATAAAIYSVGNDTTAAANVLVPLGLDPKRTGRSPYLFRPRKRRERDMVSRIRDSLGDDIGSESRAEADSTNAETKAESEARSEWVETRGNHCRIQLPDHRVEYLYGTSLNSLILHTAEEVYAGPYTYKRYWVRDAALILHALIVAGLAERARTMIPSFFERQERSGYFLSHDGEWDSNGEVLWLLDRYLRMTGETCPREWHEPVKKGAEWICDMLEKSRNDASTSNDPEAVHAGLLPAGFSAEHFGPVDFYYWDDFWAVAGLRGAARIAVEAGNGDDAERYLEFSGRLLGDIDRSLQTVRTRLGSEAVPSSPYRRMDSGAVGSLAAGYPLRLWTPRDPRLVATAGYLYENCVVRDGFFHDMTHSGINPYLTLHLAQVLLRAGTPVVEQGRTTDTGRETNGSRAGRKAFLRLLNGVASFASQAGTWAEAMHPQTGGGCMGDGHHVWAAAEWILAVRNAFLREEDGSLIIGSGLDGAWVEEGSELTFGPGLTEFGTVELRMHVSETSVTVEGTADWHRTPEAVRILLPGCDECRLAPENRIRASIRRN